AAGEGGRALDLAVGGERPAGGTGALVERPHLAVPVADVDESVGDEWRRLRRPDRPLPPDAAARRVECDDGAVAAGHPLVARAADEGLVDEIARDGGRGPGAAMRGVAPDRLAGSRVERIEAAVEGREVEA